MEKKTIKEIKEGVKLALAQASGFDVDEMDDAKKLSKLGIYQDDLYKVIDSLDRVLGTDAKIGDGFKKVKTVGELIALVAKKYFGK